jgi:protoporphyrin/coproporphyrin ferrochelatase
MTPTGVLVLGYGGPDSIDAVRPFMCNLMGREPSDELLEQVCLRYLTIGGSSPLLAIATSIAEKLSEKLADKGHDVVVAVGMRYWNPYIPEAMQALKDAGCKRIVTLSLSPFESKVAVHKSRELVDEVAEQLGLEITEAPLLATLSDFDQYLAAATAYALTQLEPNDKTVLAFTAHSLPVSDLTENDPYVQGLRDTAQAIAGRLGLMPGTDDAGEPLFSDFRAFGSTEDPRAWFLVYQSKGARPGEWLGPDLDEFIDACVRAGLPSICVCPIGFLTDHMETLYDLDVIAAERALDSGLEFARAPVPNDDDRMVDAMADLVAGLL